MLNTILVLISYYLIGILVVIQGVRIEISKGHTCWQRKESWDTGDIVAHGAMALCWPVLFVVFLIQFPGKLIRNACHIPEEDNPQ